MKAGETNGRMTSPEARVPDGFPCTLLQEHLWAMHKLQGARGLNIAMRWAVNGELSHTAAAGALQFLMRRHEALRTSFREVDGKLEQVVWPACAIKLLDVDLSFLPPAERAARAEQMARAEALDAMDPRQAPLMRAMLLRFGQGRGELLLTLHAMVADGWSTGLLLDEFQTAARAIDAGTQPEASEPELQFVDYALWQQELLASSALDQSRAFWRQQLAGAVGTRVAPDQRPPSTDGDRSSIASILLPATSSDAIDAFGREHGATRFAIAAASLALMLHRVTGDSEIVIGSQVANREEPAAEGLVGPTVNSITLRLPVVADGALRQFATTTTGIVQSALLHQRLPFEIAEGFAAAGEGRPLHAVNLVVHRSYSGTAETDGASPGRFSLVSLPSYPAGSPWELNFYLIGRDEGWRLSCEANADLYDPQTVQGLLQSWQECLHGIVTGPDRRLADCPWLLAIEPRAEPARQTIAAPAMRRREAIGLDDPARHIVRFHESGARTPMIVLNNRSVYYPLARALGEGRPFTDIQLYHPSSRWDAEACRFEDFAACAIRLVHSVQPKGPYILGGHCVYGVLAFEVARQLQAMGETTKLVALFDSWAPGYREDMSPLDRKLRQLRIDTVEHRKRLEQYRRGEIGLDVIVRKPVLRRLGLLAPEPAPDKAPDLRFDDLLTDAAKAYRPEPYDGNVVLFRSQETLRGRLFDDLMGWGPLVSGNLAKVEVDAAHQDMFRDRPARDIAAVLRARLGDETNS